MLLPDDEQLFPNAGKGRVADDPRALVCRFVSGRSRPARGRSRGAEYTSNLIPGWRAKLTRCTFARVYYLDPSA